MATRSKKNDPRSGGAKKRRVGQLKASAAKRFLAQYKEAWESRNADLAASLFTRDAHY